MAKFEPVSPEFKPIKSEPSTSLGNRQLHKQHSVMIEGGMIPRAKVMDQHMIDRYLMDGKLNLAQHRAAEILLGQATKAGIWPTGVNLEGSGITGFRNYVPFGAFPLGRTLVRVKRRYGRLHAFIMMQVVCFDKDVSGDDYQMGCLVESLDLIANRWTIRCEPLERLKAAARKISAPEGAPVAAAS